jgi:DNA (cytosine-5)-methyltransferase 1
MAAALGWAGQDTPARTIAGNRAPRWLYEDRDGTHGRVVVRTGANSMVTGRTNDDLQPYERPVDQPAPTLDSKVGSAWTLNRRQQTNGVPVRNVPDIEPAPTLTGIAGSKGQWVWERPATTVAGDPRITARCHHDHGTQGADAKTTAQVRAGDYEGTEPVKLTIAEALALQSFPPGYPVQGTKTAQFRQVGDAVPPLLAAHILAAATGRRLEQEAVA